MRFESAAGSAAKTPFANVDSDSVAWSRVVYAVPGLGKG